jgi:heme/copper-type cytochrome/quinol oxidase subunit 3
MTSTTSAPEEAPHSKRLPGDLAIWIFILAEMLAFAVFFSAYAFARAGNAEMFNLYQQTLNRNAGALNTLLLITGSGLSYWPSRPLTVMTTREFRGMLPSVFFAAQLSSLSKSLNTPRNLGLAFPCRPIRFICSTSR